MEFEIEGIQIVLSGLWIALMLTYFLGDVFRIFSGDFKKMNPSIKNMNQWLWLLISVIMLIPIVMLVLTLVLPYGVNRWVNIVAAGFLLLFNLVGLPSYESLYDKFLIVVGLIFNILSIWIAWSWVG